MMEMPSIAIKQECHLNTMTDQETSTKSLWVWWSRKGRDTGEYGYQHQTECSRLVSRAHAGGDPFDSGGGGSRQEGGHLENE